MCIRDSDGIDASDSHVEIDELLDIILEQTDIPQVRLSSLEPMDCLLYTSRILGKCKINFGFW